MTTIAYAHGCMAADSMISSSGGFFGSAKKLVAGPRGASYLAAAAGNVATSRQFLAWAAGGLVGDPPKMKSPEGNSAIGVILYAQDRFLIFDIDGWNELEADIFAVGSGSDFAKGALAAGATPEEAVRIACRFDNASGGDITTMSLKVVNAVRPYPNNRAAA
jgi:hypothetical protein